MNDRATSVVSLKGVHKTYHMGDTEIAAVCGVDLEIRRGEYVAIMGPSGSGKSTLMNLIGLLDVPEAGSYHLNGTDVTRMRDGELAAIRNRDIGFVFQQFHLLPRTSALENASLPLLYAHRQAEAERPAKLLADVGLADRQTHKPTELSGGQQQRVAIARALATGPGIVLADEPTGNLDSKSADDILAIFDKLNAQGVTIILVTHEADVAQRARRIIHMRDGKVVSDETRGERTASTPSEPHAAASRASRIAFAFRSITMYGHLAMKALLAHKMRALLSMLGILIGTMSVIAMMALGAGAKASMEEQFSSMGSNLLIVRQNWRSGSGVSASQRPMHQLTLDDADTLRSLPGVQIAAATVQSGARVIAGNRNWDTEVTGTEPDYAEIRAMQNTVGRFIQDDDLRRRERVAVIGRTVLKKLFDTRNPIGEVIRINGVAFRVVGVLPEKGAGGWRDRDDVVVIPLSTAMYRLMGKDKLDSIEVQVTRADLVAQVQQAILDRMAIIGGRTNGEENPVTIHNMAEMQSALTSTSKTMSILLSSIAAISMFVGGIGIMNIMLVSVAERTREIGLRKAVGARRGDILGQFLVEAVVISALGGLLGIVLGWTISVVMNNAIGWTTVVTWQSVAIAAGCSALTGLVFGFWPARKAAALHPIEALRYE